jgi:hypothetical protein
LVAPQIGKNCVEQRWQQGLNLVIHWGVIRAGQADTGVPVLRDRKVKVLNGGIAFLTVARSHGQQLKQRLPKL